MQEKEFLFAGNADFLQEQYHKYLQNDAALSSQWRTYFSQLAPDFCEYKPKWSKKPVAQTSTSLEYNFLMLIEHWRKMGHYLCQLDPLGMEQPSSAQDLRLTLEHFGLNQASSSNINGYAFALNQCSAEQLIGQLQQTYAASIGVEFDHISDVNQKAWLYNEFEKMSQQRFSAEQEQRFLKTLLEVETFEHFIHTKFPGAKRFSIEGGQACILALDELVNLSAAYGVEQMLFATAHRGRLATLAKVIGKSYRHIFAEFAGLGKDFSDPRYHGDVKYHMGYSSIRKVDDLQIKLSLAYNPSHLESVNSVLAGGVRALQDYTSCKEKICGVLVHGDAAFCGQGVVAESIAMASLPGYSAAGIIHLVINNQIGFTANPQDTRSGRYPTEFAKIAQIPILHVNGDDAKAVVQAMHFAAKYRHTFLKDIVVDVFCYRKYGHNEGDEPLYTQGQKYTVVKNKMPTSQIYQQKLVQQKIIDQQQIETINKELKSFFEAEFAAINSLTPLPIKWQSAAPKSYTKPGKDELKNLAKQVFSWPQDFAINPKLVKLLDGRKKDVLEEKTVDWGIAENLSFAAILSKGKNIRLSGQDVGRGTFSHRHSVLHSQLDDNTSYIPLNNLQISGAGKYYVYNSLLSEFAVLGFEYGYCLAKTNTLVIWEAQFGDFANGAQIIIDQFIASAQAKWCQTSNLVMLLPHGYEGQGPEHSSARVERFLALAADGNMQICIPSTPASYFHLLQEHALTEQITPLIVFTPKSLLRHKMAVSSLAHLCQDLSFMPVLADERALDKVQKVVLCSGKVYYDLLEQAIANNLTQVALVRLEQLYPFPATELGKILMQYSKAQEFIWCQEEPINMGAFTFLNEQLAALIKQINSSARFSKAARAASSTPATGYLLLHTEQQTSLIKQALAI